MTIIVLLADDHAIAREGVTRIREKQKGIDVVGVTGDGHEAVRLVKRHHPDVAVIDITMPELDGIEATRQVTEQCPGTRIVILSMHATAEHIHRALNAGACGYVLKESAGSEVIDAVRAAAEGRRCVSASVANTIFRDYAHMQRGAKAKPHRHAQFPRTRNPATCRRRERDRQRDRSGSLDHPRHREGPRGTVNVESSLGHWDAVPCRSAASGS